jgi:hypothetical protein
VGASREHASARTTPTCSRPSARRRGPLRGVAVIDPGRRGEELDRLVETGACGIRLNLISGPVPRWKIGSGSDWCTNSPPLDSTWKSRHSNASGRTSNPGCSAGPARWLSIIGGCRRPCLCPTPDPLRSPACWPSTCGRRRPCLVVQMAVPTAPRPGSRRNSTPPKPCGYCAPTQRDCLLGRPFVARADDDVQGRTQARLSRGPPSTARAGER